MNGLGLNFHSTHYHKIEIPVKSTFDIQSPLFRLAKEIKPSFDMVYLFFVLQKESPCSSGAFDHFFPKNHDPFSFFFSSCGAVDPNGDVT
jgi:hypothetical protein